MRGRETPTHRAVSPCAPSAAKNQALGCGGARPGPSRCWERHCSASDAHGTFLMKGEEVLNAHTHFHVGSSWKPGPSRPMSASLARSSREARGTCAALSLGRQGCREPSRNRTTTMPATEFHVYLWL